MDNGIFVANSHTGELFPVDQYTVRTVTKWWQAKHDLVKVPYWHRRQQTIIDLLLAGF